MTDNVSKLTTNTERAIAAMQAKMRAAGMETPDKEPAEILREMIQEKSDRTVAQLREDQQRLDAMDRAYWRARPWHQKLRYWVLGAFLLAALFGAIFGFPPARECVESSRWEFC